MLFDERPAPLSAAISAVVRAGARRFAAEEGYTVSLLQLVLPDPAGRFPGEAGCEPRIALMQDIDQLRLKGRLRDWV